MSMSESAPETPEPSAESPVATAAAVAAAEASGSAEATAEHAEETAESAAETAEVSGEVAVEAATVATEAKEDAENSLSISERILQAQEAQREEMAGIRQLLLDRQQAEESVDDSEVNEVPVGGSEKESQPAGKPTDRDSGKRAEKPEASSPPPGPENAAPKRGLRRRNRG